jgi:hypothetical protein
METPIKYLCTDDESGRTTIAHKNSLEKQTAGKLEITLTEPTTFEDEVNRLNNEIIANKYRGLLLDLKLDGTGVAYYRGTALVQEIHTRAAESNFQVCPLVLWSNDRKLQVSYAPDETSHDLFDLIIDKDKLKNDDYAKDRAIKLLSLAKGYESIIACKATGAKRLQELLLIPKGAEKVLDPRIAQPINSKNSSIYDQARFIHKQLLTISNNALISSKLLAARLGFGYDDKEKFEEVAGSLFPTAKYKGVFSDGWDCWWVAEVEKIWKLLPKCPGSLRNLPAESRVEFINSHLQRADLLPAQPIQFNSSTYYWTICQITHQPLDPQEGYVIDHQLYPWQLTQYISMFGKLDGSSTAKKIELDPLEIERFKENKKLVKPATKNL